MIKDRSHPILFSAPMVRAILAGEKTQTRRLVTEKHFQAFGLEKRPYQSMKVSPYGKIGSQLWGKEAWRVSKQFDELRPGEIPQNIQVEYKADDTQQELIEAGKWRTPLFMCRSLSRITLSIVEIRIERLNDCSIKDAKAEGVGYEATHAGGDFISLYKNAWEVLHGKNSWELNPLVWIISFRKLYPY